MLKIKSDIDLKELEKYGFEEGIRNLKDSEYGYIEVCSNRQLYTTYNDDEYFAPTKEYEVDDLIKEGLVEKEEK